MPNSHRMMFFIDGENIVCRYQAMRAKGYVPRHNVIHQPDEFVWTNQVELPGGCEVIRAYYYTSITGDENKLSDVINKIRQIRIGHTADRVYGSASFLYPTVFKKPRKSTKAKSVDIQMTVDILTHVYQDNVDTICLFSGDGDYASIVNEVIRRGKRAYIASFSQGFSPLLQQLGDEVYDLDPVFFDLEKFPGRI